MLTKRSLVSLPLAIGLLFGAVETANAERLVQSTTEARTYVYFNANKDAVQKLLPAGWVSNPGTGALKDANFFIALIEGIAADNAEGMPVPHQGRFAVMVVPAKNEQTGIVASMIVGGFVSQPQAAPGAYGVYAPAKFAVAKSSRSEGTNATMVEETWEVSTDTGDQLRLSISYERGVGTRAHVEPRIYAAAKPEFYRIYKADQVTEVVYSAAADAKRAQKVEFMGSGSQLSRVFDGKEQPVAVMSLPAYYRQIFLPD